MKIDEVIYEKGAFDLIPGASGKQAGKVKKIGDTTRINRGTGWYEEKTPSKLLVGIDDGGKKETLNVVKEFHTEIGRITQNRLDKIKKINGKTVEKKPGLTDADVIVDKMKKLIKK